MHVLAVPASVSRSPITLDPWWDVYLPALWGEREVVREALALVEENVDEDGARGAAYAVGARALLVLRCPAEAWRFAERAFAAGGPEADALATFLRPNGLARAEERFAASSRPGARADAACDQAVLHLATVTSSCPQRGRAGAEGCPCTRRPRVGSASSRGRTRLPPCAPRMSAVVAGPLPARRGSSTRSSCCRVHGTDGSARSACAVGSCCRRPR